MRYLYCLLDPPCRIRIMLYRHHMQNSDWWRRKHVHTIAIATHSVGRCLTALPGSVSGP